MIQLWDCSLIWCTYFNGSLTPACNALLRAVAEKESMLKFTWGLIWLGVQGRGVLLHATKVLVVRMKKMHNISGISYATVFSKVPRVAVALASISLHPAQNKKLKLKFFPNSHSFAQHLAFLIVASIELGLFFTFFSTTTFSNAGEREKKQTNKGRLFNILSDYLITLQINVLKDLTQLILSSHDQHN